ncbi:MAG: hypothetical protein SGJ09_14305 [Phycisphaerae bacterium]|nr:hypothetical protein [Phycisphaerae bacterium]MDZ4831356.1 hypothetical protein [Phycisphaerae bacterium]
MHRAVTTLYWIALVAWIASLVATAATAMAAFTALPALGVAVPSAALVYPGADDASSRFAAGFVAQRVFDAADRVALLALPALAVTMLLQASFFRWPERSWANRARVACIVAAILLETLHLVILAPRMATTLADYRSAVMQGDASSAAAHKAVFERDHVKADPLLRATMVLLVLGLAASAWVMTPRVPGGRGEIQAPRLFGTRTGSRSGRRS